MIRLAFGLALGMTAILFGLLTGTVGILMGLAGALLGVVLAILVPLSPLLLIAIGIWYLVRPANQRPAVR